MTGSSTHHHAAAVATAPVTSYAASNTANYDTNMSNNLFAQSSNMYALADQAHNSANLDNSVSGALSTTANNRMATANTMH